MIKNILANDNVEDYYSESRSDNYFDEQDSVREDEDDDDSDSLHDSELDDDHYKFGNTSSSLRKSCKDFMLRKSQVGFGLEAQSSKRVLSIMKSLLSEIKESYNE